MILWCTTAWCGRWLCPLTCERCEDDPETCLLGSRHSFILFLEGSDSCVLIGETCFLKVECPARMQIHVGSVGHTFPTGSLGYGHWSNMSAIRLFHLTAVTKLLWSSLLLRTQAQDVCNTSTKPNPVVLQYPDTPTGTFNATLAIVPVPLDTARQLIPPQYAILEEAYRTLLPNFPEGMYPVLLQAGLDHDIQLLTYGITVPTFHVRSLLGADSGRRAGANRYPQRIGWSFPFVDLLGDGFSSFTWAPAQMISSTVPIAIAGSEEYGTTVHPSAFQPGCDAYARSAAGAALTLEANALDGSAVHFAMAFSPLQAGVDANPFPVGFYQNVTNQPIFANGVQCDRQVRLFNSTLNQGEFAPVPVKGRIVSNLSPMDFSAGLDGVFGMLVDTPFVEFNGLECQSLKGYSETGSGS